MKTKKVLSTAVVLMLIALVGQAFAATAGSATVGPCPGPGFHYTGIQLAVNAVTAGSTVNVCPGSYPEQIIINKNLRLVGIPYGTSDAAVIVPPSGGLVSNGSDIFGNPVSPADFCSK
jgi:hypothetical protein